MAGSGTVASRERVYTRASEDKEEANEAGATGRQHGARPPVCRLMHTLRARDERQH